MQSVDRRGGEAFREMTAHRISHCLRRGERNPVRLELRQHMLDRAWAQPFRCEDIGAVLRAPLEEAAGKALARALERSRRRDLVRGDVVLEGNAACPRQSPVIVGLARASHWRSSPHAEGRPISWRALPPDRAWRGRRGDRPGRHSRRAASGQSPVARPHAFGMTCCRPPPHATGPPQLLHEYFQVVEPEQSSTRRHQHDLEERIGIYCNLRL